MKETEIIKKNRKVISNEIKNITESLEEVVFLNLGMTTSFEMFKKYNAAANFLYSGAALQTFIYMQILKKLKLEKETSIFDFIGYELRNRGFFEKYKKVR